MRSSGQKVIDLATIRKKNAPKCIFCGSSEMLQFFRHQAVCLDCLRSIGCYFSDQAPKVISRSTASILPKSDKWP